MSWRTSENYTRKEFKKHLVTKVDNLERLLKANNKYLLSVRNEKPVILDEDRKIIANILFDIDYLYEFAPHLINQRPHFNHLKNAEENKGQSLAISEIINNEDGTVYVIFTFLIYRGIYDVYETAMLKKGSNKLLVKLEPEIKKSQIYSLQDEHKYIIRVKENYFCLYLKDVLIAKGLISNDNYFNLQEILNKQLNDGKLYLYEEDEKNPGFYTFSY